MLHIPRALQAHQPKQHNNKDNTAGEKREAEDIRACTRSRELGETRRHCPRPLDRLGREFRQAVTNEEKMQASGVVHWLEWSIVSIAVVGYPGEDGRVRKREEKLSSMGTSTRSSFTVGRQGLDSRLTARLHTFPRKTQDSFFLASRCFQMKAVIH
jgi:hypothetical protein